MLGRERKSAVYLRSGIDFEAFINLVFYKLEG